MQTSKLLPLLSVAALLAASVQTTFADDEAQARAREALRQKMAELDAQSGKPAPKPAPAPKVTPVPKAEPKVTPTPPPVVEQPKPAVVEQPKIAPVQPKPAPPVVAQPPKPTPPSADPEGQDRARAAVREKMNQLDTQSPNAAKPTPAPKVAAAPKPQPAPVPNNGVAAPPTPAPAKSTLEAPPSGVSSTKEARLAELLQKYRSDAISAEEYHAQRAEILKSAD